MGTGFTVNWNTFFAGLAGLLALVSWFATWRKTAMAEGKHLSEVSALKDRLTDVEKKAEFLRGCSEESNSELKAIKTDIEWVKLTLSEIKDLLRKP
jgi:hypothetical protein